MRCLIVGCPTDNLGARHTQDAPPTAPALRALGVPLAVCRVHVDLPLVRRRLRARHALDPKALDRHLERSGESQSILDGAGVEDYAVDGTHGTPEEVAALVLKGWQTD